MADAYRYARVAWTIDDILEFRPGWTDEQCEEFLNQNEKYIRDAMIVQGRLAIDALLPSDTPTESAVEVKQLATSLTKLGETCLTSHGSVGIVRVTKDEFETTDGSVFPIRPPLVQDMTVDEFEKHYRYAVEVVRRGVATGVVDGDSSGDGPPRRTQNGENGR